MSNTNLSKLLANLRKTITESQPTQNQQPQQVKPKNETIFDGVKPSNTSSQTSLNDNLFEKDDINSPKPQGDSQSPAASVNKDPL